MSQTVKSDNSSKQIAEIWKLFRANEKRLKETRKILEENARQQKEDRLQWKEEAKEAKEVEKQRKREAKEAEIKRQKEAKEAEQKWRQEVKESDRKWQKKLDQRMNSMEGLFTNQWGKLVEALAEESLTTLMKEHGLALHNTHTHVKCAYKDQESEFDIIATNGRELVTVEVKTTLRPDDVKVFIRKLKDFRDYFSEYRDFKVYGAMACLQEVQGAFKLAISEGLYVIRAAGKNAVLKNPRGFVPKEWNP